MMQNQLSEKIFEYYWWKINSAQFSESADESVYGGAVCSVPAENDVGSNIVFLFVFFYAFSRYFVPGRFFGFCFSPGLVVNWKRLFGLSESFWPSEFEHFGHAPKMEYFTWRPHWKGFWLPGYFHIMWPQRSCSSSVTSHHASIIYVMHWVISIS